MADVVTQLLGSETGRAEALTRVQKLEPSDAPEIAETLRDAAKNDVVRALVVLHILSLLKAPVVQRVLALDGLLEQFLSQAQKGDAACAMGHMLAGAASHAPLRAILAKDPAVEAWVAAHSSQAKITEVDADESATASADLVRIKLAIQTEEGKGPLGLDGDACTALYTSLRGSLVDGPAAPDAGLLDFDARAAACTDALEGLYYLVKLPALRDRVADDKALLAVFVRLLQSKARKEAVSTSSLPYLVASILATVAAYAPPRTEEQRRVEALRRSAVRTAEQDIAPQDAARRCRALVSVGLAAPLVAVALRSSTSEDELRRTLSSLFLALVTEQDGQLRGKLLQQGVARALLVLSRDAYAALAKPDAPAAVLAPLQALAKLTITTDPSLMYRMDGSAAQGVQYLAALYFAPQGSLLQLFEATMALTNLASLSPEMAGVVGRAPPPHANEHKDIASSLVSQFLMHDEDMVRRALVELLCNLVQDEQVFAFWSGEAEEPSKELVEGDEGSEPQPAGSSDVALRLHTAQGRLRLLVSLCRLDDSPPEPTTLALALAAAGALATLSSSPATCQRLLALPPSADETLASLVLPECTVSLLDAHQLALRGLVIAASLAQYAAYRKKHNDSATSAEVKKSALLGACRDYVAENARFARDSSEPRLASMRQQALTIAVDVLQDAQKL